MKDYSWMKLVTKNVWSLFDEWNAMGIYFLDDEKIMFMDEIDHTHAIGHMGEMNYIDELELQKWNWSQRLN